MAQLPKGGLVRGHDKPIHGSCAIYFPGGIGFRITTIVVGVYHLPILEVPFLKWWLTSRGLLPPKNWQTKLASWKQQLEIGNNEILTSFIQNNILKIVHLPFIAMLEDFVFFFWLKLV